VCIPDIQISLSEKSAMHFSRHSARIPIGQRLTGRAVGGTAGAVSGFEVDLRRGAKHPNGAKMMKGGWRMSLG
jgi:hypothetical protein